MVEKKVLSKVVLLGDMGVGKTTLLNSFMDESTTLLNSFMGAGQAKATVGSDFRKKDIKVGNTTNTLQVWDTAG